MSERLPPHLERLHDELMAAAHTRAEAPLTPRRRRRRLALVVAFAVLGTTGAALAATATNPIDWLRGGDPAVELRVGVDATARVDGDFPAQIVCAAGIDAGDADCRTVPGLRCTRTTNSDGGSSSSCTEPAHAVDGRGRAPAGSRRFELMARVLAPPHLDAQVLRAALDGRAADEPLIPPRLLTPDTPAQYRVTVGEVREAADRAPDDFWRGLEVLASVQGGTISSSDPDNPANSLVPPAGVARFVTCRDEGSLRCRPLQNGERLPVGAPLYARDPEGDWRSVRTRPQSGSAFLELQHQVFGRDLAASEQVLLLAFLTPVVTEDSGDGGSAHAPAVAVEERTPRTSP